MSKVQREQVRIEAEGESPISKGPQIPLRTSSSEVDQLVSELRALPEVREELVQQTIQKLRDGEYSTRESAEQTADAVLRMLNKE